MSEWINNKIPLYKRVIKPCHACGFCPYGQLVEEYPIDKKSNKMSCDIYGHDCPVFYQAEPLFEGTRATRKDYERMNKEFKKRFWSEVN